MIWQFIRLYLAIGVCVIAFEWMLLIIAKKGMLFAKNLKPATKAACVVPVFLVEVAIWPRQLFVMACSWYKALTGKLSNEELIEIFNLLDEEWPWHGDRDTRAFICLWIARKTAKNRKE